MQVKQKNKIKRTVDIILTVVLLCLMAYQATGEAIHEWLGIGMTALVILHQALNAKWYSSLFKGKYHAYRIMQTTVNLLLLVSFFITALCGIAMSAHAVPFMYGILPLSLARLLHLSVSHWSFVFMGLHLGVHLPLIVSKLSDKKRKVFTSVFGVFALAGLFFFIKNRLFNYLFFQTAFAFFDFKKTIPFVFVENALMLIFFAFIGTVLSMLCRRKSKDRK